MFSLLIILLRRFLSFFKLAERKLLAVIQRRRGPNVVGL